jgi:SAM-dependent methyltransferase
MKGNMHYSEYVDLFKYDEGISSHPYIDACNASIFYRLLEAIGIDGKTKRVLDAGAGSGQVTRLLQGIPFLEIDACDIDLGAKKFFLDNPETANIPYHEWDIVNDKFDKHYDAIIIRGVYHHIPKSQRPVLLANLSKQSDTLINADEGILEYSNQSQRIEHCDKWYGYVIGEAKRRKLSGLVQMENEYLQHEKLNTADDGGDYKESPSDFIADANQAGLKVTTIDRLGNWEKHKGGFYTTVIK